MNPGPPRERPSPQAAAASRRRAAAELVLLFLLPPVLIRLAPVSVPKIPLLLAAAAACGAILLRDPEFPRGRLRLFPLPAGATHGVCLRALGAGLLLAAAVGLWEPGLFFSFPRQHPLLWVLVMALYPFLSALPQELIYRVFFFHRCRLLLPDIRLRAAFSALSFAWLHLIFDNWLAPLFSLAGGALFAWTYARTGSLGAVALEHALIGNLLFTLGWGGYFYRGI